MWWKHALNCKSHINYTYLVTFTICQIHTSVSDTWEGQHAVVSYNILEVHSMSTMKQIAVRENKSQSDNILDKSITLRPPWNIILTFNCTLRFAGPFRITPWKKLGCPATPLILMNPLHYPVTMAKIYDLTIDVEGKTKKNFFWSIISGMCHFGPM